ncbi:MAG: DUF4142 domain-containing protein [Vulcanimicrobiaceae bacterium]
MNRLSQGVLTAWALAVLFALCLPLQAAAALSKTDASFLESAMGTQLGRYAIATLGEKRGTTVRVRTIAKTIATEASYETRWLDKIAKGNGVAPAKKPTLALTYAYSHLSGVHGAAFDRAFARALRDNDAVALYNDRQEIKSGADATLKAFAKRNAAALQKELAALKPLV